MNGKTTIRRIQAILADSGHEVAELVIILLIMQGHPSAQTGLLELPRKYCPVPAPKWRLVACRGEEPFRVALNTRRRLLPPRATHCFIGKSYCRFLDSLLIAAFNQPIGVYLSSVMAATTEPHRGWMNAHDRVNAARGISPDTTARLKTAARQALGHASGQRLRAYTIVPLPHTRGEVMVLHPTGWRGRGLAWSQGDARMALVWQCS